jgi:hypothetical protein
VSQLSYALRKLKELRIGNSLTYSEQPWSKGLTDRCLKTIMKEAKELELFVC